MTTAPACAAAHVPGGAVVSGAGTGSPSALSVDPV